MKDCPVCYKSLDDNCQICDSCGYAFTGRETTGNGTGVKSSSYFVGTKYVCPVCGKPFEGTTTTCPNCKTHLRLENCKKYMPANYQPVNKVYSEEKSGSVGGGFCLGFFLGIIGLIIGLFSKPDTKSGAIFGFFLQAVIGVVIFIIKKL